MRLILIAALLASAATPAGAKKDREAPAPTQGSSAEPENPYPSTYKAYPGVATAIRGATIFDGEGGRIDNGVIFLSDGKVTAIGGPDTPIPADIALFDGTGKYVTPGVIDIHSHLGDYPSPSVDALSDGNEATSPVTAHVWAEHSIWPQDAGFGRALANGGVTSLQILPGSANLFGGRSVTLKNVPARTMQGMKFPGAPYGLKMACGENPKRVYGSKGREPSTRMGNMAVNRQTWIKAREYQKKRAAGKDQTRDLGMETLADVLEGKILVHNHCYRADEMANVIDMSKEFGYKVTAFHHAVEAYKIADLLRDNGICAALWGDWYGFKMEAGSANCARCINAPACC
ncbi:MAG: amidohydrolase, partial [Alphaproteobacteria bacterium]|nr:amidohydrolase [Alphaproteobacteria bacterium]